MKSQAGIFPLSLMIIIWSPYHCSATSSSFLASAWIGLSSKAADHSSSPLAAANVSSLFISNDQTLFFSIGSGQLVLSLHRQWPTTPLLHRQRPNQSSQSTTAFRHHRHLSLFCWLFVHVCRLSPFKFFVCNVTRINVTTIKKIVVIACVIFVICKLLFLLLWKDPRYLAPTCTPANLRPYCPCPGTLSQSKSGRFVHLQPTFQI